MEREYYKELTRLDWPLALPVSDWEMGLIEVRRPTLNVGSTISRAAILDVG